MGPQIKGAHSKKRKLPSRVEEISFDDSARHQFLTGFRKRKQERIKHAQNVAVEKMRELKRQSRKQMREERNADFERALEEHKRQLKLLAEENESGDDAENGSSDAEAEEWEGIAEPPAVDYEAEYVDEDKYTTVTVEEMDPSKREALQSDDDSSDERPAEQAEPSEDVKSTKQSKTKKQSDQPKKKKKKFRYESKEDRKASRMREKRSNHKKAQARRER